MQRGMPRLRLASAFTVVRTRSRRRRLSAPSERRSRALPMASRAACERPRHGSLGSLASSFPGETLSLQRCVTLQRLLACARAWYQSSAISVTFRTLCRDPRGDLRKVPREGTFDSNDRPSKQRCSPVTVSQPTSQPRTDRLTRLLYWSVETTEFPLILRRVVARYCTPPKEPENGPEAR